MRKMPRRSHSARNSARSTSFNGTFNFNRDANNPLDSNYPYSNAILGIVDAYTESNAHPASKGRFTNVEWFVQDTWKATRRLTVDAMLSEEPSFALQALTKHQAVTEARGQIEAPE